MDGVEFDLQVAELGWALNEFLGKYLSNRGLKYEPTAMTGTIDMVEVAREIFIYGANSFPDRSGSAYCLRR